MSDNDLDDFDMPQMIFLKGVFIKDISTTMEDIFYDNLNESIVKVDAIKYDKIPRKFLNKKTWLLQTNLHCYMCDLQYNTVPIPVVINMKIVGNEPHFDVSALCCNFSCAMSLINITSFKKWEMEQNLYTVSEILTGKRISFIEESPSKYIMNKYGGDKSEEQYKELLKELNDYEQ